MWINWTRFTVVLVQHGYAESKPTSLESLVTALRVCCLLLLITSDLFADEAPPARWLIEPKLLHLRSGSEREWSEFPETPDGQRLEVAFAAKQNAAEQTLFVRQQDVKQSWNVVLNEKRIGTLTIDENDMVVAFAIPAQGLVDGDNSLVIESPSGGKAASDDIRVGQIVLHNQPRQQVLKEATIEIEVVDAGTPNHLPSRITVIDSNGSLQTLAVESNERQFTEWTSLKAVRPGIVYSRGTVKIGLPSGRYTIFAGRGFEYSLARTEVTVSVGDAAKMSLAIRREVPTEGYVACDTHVHTLTHSGHGDATIDERMLTLAGEGIELPIATDHNQHIDYEETATRMGVRQFFTPVMGNEVTTPRGHFNIFPIETGARLVDHKQTDWWLLFDDIQRTPGVKVAILNHARDLHSGVRPFGPDHHNAVVGENLDGWPLRFNAMEVINSGATQSDPLRLFHDWMGLLNRGLNVTPVGSSDSHDVGRHFVGQGRTYIRCADRHPFQIDVDAAVNSFVRGRVMVSYGLLAELTVNAKYRSGELATCPDDEVRVEVRVLGPHWVRADRVLLFANGRRIRDEAISADVDHKPLPTGVKWTGTWTIPKPSHDLHLVAIALGPGIDGLYWKTAKPYQPTSPDWKSQTIGCSGAVWIDADGDGKRTSARDYAERLFAASKSDFARLINSLSKYDAEVASQAAHLCQSSGMSLQSAENQRVIRQGSRLAQDGFHAYLQAWRENQIARAKP